MFAFGLSHEVGGGDLPQAQRTGDALKLRLTQPVGVTGITYGAEWSATLQPGSWTALPDEGSGDEHIFSVPLGGNGKLFMRLKVTGR